MSSPCRLSACLSLPALLTACAADLRLPHIETTSFSFLESSDLALELDNEGDPASKPGRLAGEGAGEAVRDCIDGTGIIGILISPFCAAVGAAGGAVVGAAVTGAGTLPEADAQNLRQATIQAMASGDWQRMLPAALERSAPAHNIVVRSIGSDPHVNVYVQNLQWQVVVGNRALIDCTVWVVVESGGEQFTQNYQHKSEAQGIEDWVVDQGRPIAVALEQIFVDLGDRIWADLGS